MLNRVIKGTVAVLALGLVGAQFVQPERTNPPADPSTSFEAVAKPRPEVAAIVNRACRDCHSNKTVWPWYSFIAPMSWLVARDVKVGRAQINFSQWNIYGAEMTRLKMTEVCEAVSKGKMPLWFFLPLHPEARLSAEDVKTLCSAP